MATKATVHLGITLVLFVTVGGGKRASTREFLKCMHKGNCDINNTTNNTHFNTSSLGQVSPFTCDPDEYVRHPFGEECDCEGQLFMDTDCSQGFVCQGDPDTDQGCLLKCGQGEVLVSTQQPKEATLTPLLCAYLSMVTVYC